MQDCKLNILSTIPDNQSCSQSFVGAVLLTASTCEIDTKLIQADNEIKNKLTKIISRFYPYVVLHNWDNFLLLSGDLTDLETDCEINEQSFSAMDKLTILKGIFLTSAKLYYNQDSNKNSVGYSLEFVLRDEISAYFTFATLKELGFNFKKTKRKNLIVIYTKNSNNICDLLVTIGASYTALEIQNNLAIREIRNNANRQNNCFESNLDKTITASAEQLKAINYLIEHYSIDYFDENLKEVALARIANPDVSLNELRLLLNNNISRAGIKYRLDKIIQMYKEEIGENN